MKGGAGEVPRDPDDPYVRAIAPGKVTAPIVGGNLFTFVHLIGTPFEPVFDGAILFFEEVHEPTYVIEVHLDQLRLAGKLDGIAGVVIGEMKDCGWSEETPGDPARPFARGCLRAASSPARASRCYTSCLSDTGSIWPRSRWGSPRPSMPTPGR